MGDNEQPLPWEENWRLGLLPASLAEVIGGTAVLWSLWVPGTFRLLSGAGFVEASLGSVWGRFVSCVGGFDLSILMSSSSFTVVCH